MERRNGEDKRWDRHRENSTLISETCVPHIIFFCLRLAFFSSSYSIRNRFIFHLAGSLPTCTQMINKLFENYIFISIFGKNRISIIRSALWFIRVMKDEAVVWLLIIVIISLAIIYLFKFNIWIIIWMVWWNRKWPDNNSNNAEEVML